MLRSVWWRGTDSWRWRSFRLEDSSWSPDPRALQVRVEPEIVIEDKTDCKCLKIGSQILSFLLDCSPLLIGAFIIQKQACAFWKKRDNCKETSKSVALQSGFQYLVDFKDAVWFIVFFVSAAYIKVYLLENSLCIAKKKTKSVRKSLDPLYNQVLVFSESPQGKVVQVNSIFTFCEENEGYLCKTPPEDASEGLPFYCSPSQKIQVLKYLALGLAWAIEIVLLAL